MSPRRRVLLVVAASAAIACTKIGTDPTVAVSVAFDSLPSPGIVLGDTLRDSAGAVAPIRAVAFNVRGEPIPDAPITYFAKVGRDTLRVDPATGVVVAGAAFALRAVSVVLFPQVNGIPGPQRTLLLTLRPDSIGPNAPADTLRYSTAADTGQNVSGAIQARVLHDSANTGSFLPVRAWIVRFTVEYRGATQTDTAIALLVNDQGAPSSIDTTDASGIASRRVRLHAPPASAADSVVVTARASWRGGALRGSPARIRVPVVVRIGARE